MTASYLRNMLNLAWRKQEFIASCPLLLLKPNGDKVPAMAAFDADGTLVVREDSR